MSPKLDSRLTDLPSPGTASHWICLPQSSLCARAGRSHRCLRKMANTVAGAPQRPLRVLLLTDVRLYSGWLAQTLAEHDSIESVEVFSRLTAALDCIAQEHVDVVAVDLATAQRLNAVTAIRELQRSVLLVAFAVPESD